MTRLVKSNRPIAMKGPTCVVLMLGFGARREESLILLLKMK